MGVHTFHKHIRPKVIVKTFLEHELTFYVVAVRYVYSTPRRLSQPYLLNIRVLFIMFDIDIWSICANFLFPSPKAGCSRRSIFN